MPPFKPMKLRDYRRWIACYGWHLEKAGTDWKILDENNAVVLLNLIVTHPGREIPAIHVRKTQKAIDLLETEPHDA